MAKFGKGSGLKLHRPFRGLWVRIPPPAQTVEHATSGPDLDGWIGEPARHGRLPQSRALRSINLVEPQLTKNAHLVLEHRYLARDAKGNVVETPGEMFRRVATDVASAEAVWAPSKSKGHREIATWAERFCDVMTTLAFLPNSPTLMNAGRASEQLAACFVLPVPDSLEGIFETLKEAALIQQSGGGTGFSFTAIRPRGDVVATTSGIASGPVSFMEVYDAATEHIRQGGTRRGANMGILRVDHPDIVEFINAKLDETHLRNFNISVGITTAFWSAMHEDADYPLINPRTGLEVTRLRARDVLNRIAEAAWRCGDPGLIFLNRINSARTNPTPKLSQIEATNPCGEQPLAPYEACTLGSVNLMAMSDHSGSIDWNRLRHIVHTAVRFLDNVVELSRYPVAEITHMTRDGNRKVGLGLMGWADLLVTAQIPYDSEEALSLAGKVMSFISREADAASEALALERGSFPNWSQSAYAEQNRPIRNATRTTIAPTGTISLIAGCSSGIEPLYALSVRHHVLDGRVLCDVHPGFIRLAKEAGVSKDAIGEVLHRGHATGVAGIPEHISSVCRSAHEISPEWHVRMQATFQQHVDGAVSKTVNFPNHAKVTEIAEVFILAEKLRCTGITVFRDGCKDEQVLVSGNSDPGKAQNISAMKTESLSKLCPDCGDRTFVLAEGCGGCLGCGYSTC